MYTCSVFVRLYYHCSSLFSFYSQGEFSAIIELPEGEHEYKFCVDGRWIHDPNAVSSSR